MSELKQLIPIGMKILLERVEEEKKEGDIKLQADTKLVPNKGRVVAVGQGLDEQTSDAIKKELLVGTIVYYAVGAAVEMRIGEKDLIIVNYNSIHLKEIE